MIHQFPIPGLDAGPWGGVALGVVAVAGFVVLVWQAIRYFRNDRNDRNDRNGDEH